MGILDELGEVIRNTLLDPEMGVGTSITYIPAGGDPIDAVAIVEYGEDLNDARWGTVLRSEAKIWVDSKGITNMAYGDTVIIDGVEWTVEQTITRVCGFYHLLLKRDVRPKFGQGR